MVKESLEERIQLLEESNKQQAKKIQRLEDVFEIPNLMGKYVWRHNDGLDCDAPDTLYAQKTLGITSEVAHWGGLRMMT